LEWKKITGLGGRNKTDRRITSRKGAKHVLSPSAKLRINSVEGGAKFGEIKVGGREEKLVGRERGLGELGVLAGKEFRRSVSRKGAKGAK